MNDQLKIKLLKLKLLFVDEASIKFDEEIDGVTEKFIVTITKHKWEHDIPKPDWNVLGEDAFEKFQEDVVDNYTHNPFIANYSYKVSHVSEPENYFFVDYHDIWDLEGAIGLASQDFGIWNGWKHNGE
tara:strand:- start:1189 stop:1572 length:384 start_codon:yes stop_codon:yes gene_type:complete